jgi:hypothetical protein
VALKAFFLFLAVILIALAAGWFETFGWSDGGF